MTPTEAPQPKDNAASWRQLFVLQEIDAQLDQLRENQQLAELLMDRRHAHLEAERVRARQKSHEFIATLDRFERDRVALISGIAPDLVSHYEAARRRWMMRPWVLTTTGASCGACGFELPSELRGGLEGDERPIRCPRCGRLLVWGAPSVAPPY